MNIPRLVRRFAAGDTAAVTEMYDRYSGAVFTVALGALGDRWLAEEAVQVTFLQAWRAADRLDPGRDPGPWFYAIARRVAIDLYRRERRHKAGALAEDVEITPVPPGLEDAWEAWQVRCALDALPEQEREVMRATHYLGLTQAAVAERLGIPLGTVKSTAYRAHRRLAASLAHLQESTG